MDRYGFENPPERPFDLPWLFEPYRLSLDTRARHMPEALRYTRDSLPSQRPPHARESNKAAFPETRHLPYCR